MRLLTSKPQRSSEFGIRNAEFSPFIPHSPFPIPHSEAGFTLIEIMLGTSIMVIVLVAMLGSFFGQSTLNQNSRNMMAAMNDATRVMEQIRQQNVASVVGSTCAQPTPFPSARPGVFKNGAIVGWMESWNEWLDASGKSLVGSGSLAGSNDAYEIVAVTCQAQDGGTAPSDYCGWTATGKETQVGRREWYPWFNGSLATTNGHTPFQGGIPTGLDPRFNPIRVTVAVGWAQKRQGGGTLPLGGSGSEFTYNRIGVGKGAIVQEQLRVGPDADNDGIIESPAMLTTLVTCR